MAITQYKVLHDTDARPMPPGPYCVFNVSEPEIAFHSSSDRLQEAQTQMVLVTFSIHARSTPTEDGLDIAARLAEAVAAVYDSTNPLNFLPDRYVDRKRLGDLIEREGDEEWVIRLRYEYTLDAALNI